MTSRHRRAVAAAARLSAQRRPATSQTFPDPRDPTISHEVGGLILDYYQRHYDELHGVEDLDGRGGSGALGAPIGPERSVRWAQARERGYDREQPFERGTIFLDSANGRLDAVRFIFGVKFIGRAQHTFDSGTPPTR